MEQIRTFNTYKQFKQFCFDQTGSNPSEPGISLTLRNQTAILRSNDGTNHYPDDMSDVNNPKYTLFGPSGDQSMIGRFNATLLNKNKIKNVFLYRVIKKKSKKQYLWYGKYHIAGNNQQPHVGLDGKLRTVIMLQLQRIQAPIEDLTTIEYPRAGEVPEFIIKNIFDDEPALVDFDNESTTSEETLLDSDEETFTLLDSDEEFEDEDEDIPDLQKILDVCSKINLEMTELTNSLKKK